MLSRNKKKKKQMSKTTNVDKANALLDPLKLFPELRIYQSKEIDCSLYTQKVTLLNEFIKKSIFDLTKRNMQDRYEECSWGWNDTEKRTEMMEESAWYLIAENTNGSLLGFSHFRFDMDYNREVLYCYELQLEPDLHGKGLGKFMMEILEKLASSNKMEKVVLTVLKNNPFSNFFKKIGYVLDETSPIDSKKETYSYEILSKNIT